MIYDLIGDIHGFLEPLRALFIELNYSRETEILWKPPENHKTLFIGDYIDRGDSSVAVLQTVKAMVDAGYAIALLGNHEYNAILFHTKDKTGNGYLRPHIRKNEQQHQETVDDFENRGLSIDPWIEWFKSLPLYFETDKMLAIHACPEIRSLNAFKNHSLIVDSHLSNDFISLAAAKGTDEYLIIEQLLKGPEKRLPAGNSIKDPKGVTRFEVRCNWWDLSVVENEFTNWGQIAISIDKKSKDKLSEIPLSHEDLKSVKQKAQVPENKMIFVGHYWEKGIVRMKTERIVCLDYSVAKGGKLVCFSYDEDGVADDSCFTEII